jgi:hypothetical protein
MKIAPILDIENLVPIEEILGGGAVAVACSVGAVSDEDLATAGLDDPDEAAADALEEPSVDEVVAEEDEAEADVEVLDELAVEVTEEVIVN